MHILPCLSIFLKLLHGMISIGATFVSKSAQKNARRRAKKGNAKAEANTSEVGESGHGQSPTTGTVSTPQVETAAQGEPCNVAFYLRRSIRYLPLSAHND